MPDARAGAILRAAFPGVGSDDPVAYCTRENDVFQALSLAWLFWPRLVELHGAVFVALYGDDEAEIAARLRTAGRPDRPPMAWGDAVDSFNWFELDQLFARWREPREFVAEAEAELAGVLVQTWTARLATAYPERRFAVDLLPPDDAVGLRIAVRQTSPALPAPTG